MTYSCEMVAEHAEYVCGDEIHRGAPLSCPDRLIVRADSGTYYLLIHDGTASDGGGVEIAFCPWCATLLSRDPPPPRADSHPMGAVLTG